MTPIESQAVGAARFRSRSSIIEWLALIAAVVVMLGVLSPPADNAADRSFSAHMLQHMTLIDVTAPLLALAWPLLLRRWRATRFVIGLDAAARPTDGALRTNASRTIYLMIGMLAMGLLAALITFANRPIYPSSASSSSGGRSPLADQHLGGGMMWLIGTAAIALAAVLSMRDEG